MTRPTASNGCNLASWNVTCISVALASAVSGASLCPYPSCSNMDRCIRDLANNASSAAAIRLAVGQRRTPWRSPVTRMWSRLHLEPRKLFLAPGSGSFGSRFHHLRLAGGRRDFRKDTEYVYLIRISSTMSTCSDSPPDLEEVPECVEQLAGMLRPANPQPARGG